MRRGLPWFLFAGAVVCNVGFAQNLLKPWWLSLGVGISQVEGDQVSRRPGPMAAVSLGYHISPYAAVSLYASTGLSGGTGGGVGWNRTATAQFGGELRVYFRPVSRLSPFLGAGGGVTGWQTDGSRGSWVKEPWDKEVHIGTSGGVEYLLSPKFSFQIGVRYDYVLSDDLEGKPGGSEKDQIAAGFVGLVLRFGHWFADDPDDDGVPNALDLEPTRPEDPDGYQDHDGVPEAGPPAPEKAGEGEDRSRPVVIHRPVYVAPVGNTIFLRAQVYEDRALRTVALLYRPIGTPRWNVVRMKPGEGEWYEARIPGFDVRFPGTEYAIVAVDQASNLGFSGMIDRPHVVRPISSGVGWKILGGAMGVAGWGSVGYLLWHRE
ncbi:MAG: porin family protein [candidate division KSB1 bacterium]|nr:porin family protein [candidate division KSB1 bacterium]